MSQPSPAEIELLEFETFEPLVGSDFALSSDEKGEAQATLKLSSAVHIGEMNPFGRKPFSLVFEGDPNADISQGSYWFQHAKLGTHLIFIVPISSDSSCRRCQAIFN
ncbi:MAG TPA: hypothetical protein VGL56_05590 [Fimbriimonadaceae bacterium]|jgi:hypothetical protein